MRTLNDLEKIEGWIFEGDIEQLAIERVRELQVAIKNFQNSPNPPVSLDIIREYRGAINELIRMFNLTDEDIKEGNNV